MNKHVTPTLSENEMTHSIPRVKSEYDLEIDRIIAIQAAEEIKRQADAPWRLLGFIFTVGGLFLWDQLFFQGGFTRGIIHVGHAIDWMITPSDQYY